MLRLDQNNQFSELDDLLGQIVDDIDILAGDKIGPSNAKWQDISDTLSVNMKIYAEKLDLINKGKGVAFIAFPSIRDKLTD